MANQIDNDAKIIGEADNGFGQCHIKTLSDGTLFACQIADHGDVEVYTSSDNGVSWVLDKSLTPTYTARSLCLAISELDDVFLSYIDDQNQTTVYTTIERRDPTGTWSQVLRLQIAGFNNTVKSNFLMTYNRSFNRLCTAIIYVTTSNTYISTRYSDNKGATFTYPSYPYYSSVRNLSIISDGALTLCSCFSLDTSVVTGNWYIQFARETEGTAGSVHGYILTDPSGLEYVSGSTPATNLNLVAGFRPAGLVLDSSDNLYYAVYQVDPGYCYKVYRNGVLILEENYGSDELKRGMFSIGADNSDNVYIFYAKESDDKIYYRQYNGSTWSNETIATHNLGARPSCEHHTLNTSSQLAFIYFGS